MQSTVNSVLSPTSNVSSKSTLSPQTTESSQGQFAEDFNRAKQALDSSASSKNRPEKELERGSGQTDSSIPSDSPSKDADSVQENTLKKGTRSSANHDSNALGKTDVSGNRLQLEGESSPEESAGTDGEFKHTNSGESATKSKSTSPHIAVSSGVGADSDTQLAKLSSNLPQSEKTIPSATGMTPSQEHVNSAQAGKLVNGAVGVDDHVVNNRINSDGVEQSKLIKNTPNFTGTEGASGDRKLGEAVSREALSNGQENTVRLSNQNGTVQMVDGQPHLHLGKAASQGGAGHLAIKEQEGEQTPQLDIKADTKGNKVVTSSVEGDLGLKTLKTEATHAQTTAVHLDQNGKPETDKTVVLGQGEVASPSSEDASDLLLNANGGSPVSHNQRGVHGDEGKANDISSKMSKIPPEVRALMAAENKEDKVKSTASNVDLSALSPMAQKQALASAKKASEKGAENVTDPSSSDKKETKKSGDGELSWVLSQMGASPIAPVSAAVTGVAATARGTSSASKSSNVTQSIGAQVSTSKVADQVALANALKGSVTGAPDTPLILANAGSTTETSGLLNGKGSSKASLLTNEPIELRKKEQDAMIGKMVGQLDGVSKDSDTGGMGSSLANNVGRLAATGTALGATNPIQPTPTQQQNLAMSVPLNHPGWAGEMSQKVAWIAHNGAHSAHIKLDPPELGSLTVKVSVDSDNNNTQVSFVAATHHARDLLEGQMGRLRDMLAQQGMDLGNVNVDVSQQDMSGTQYQTADGDQPQLNLGSIAGQDNGEEEPVLGNMSYVTPAGIDYYA